MSSKVLPVVFLSAFLALSALLTDAFLFNFVIDSMHLDAVITLVLVGWSTAVSSCFLFVDGPRA